MKDRNNRIKGGTSHSHHVCNIKSVRAKIKTGSGASLSVHCR